MRGSGALRSPYHYTTWLRESGREGGCIPSPWVAHRIADPHSFHPDPDPAFYAEYRSGSGFNSDPDPIQVQGFNDQKWGKMTAEKKKNFDLQKLLFTYP